MNNRLPSSKSQSSGTNPRNSKPAQGPAKKRSFIIPIVLVLTGCAVFAFAAWSAVTSPVLASILNGNANAPQFEARAPGESYAQVYLAKPTYTAVAQVAAQQVVVVQPTATLTPMPEVVSQPVIAATEAPTEAVFIAPTVTTTAEAVAVVETGVAVAEAVIVQDTPTPEYVAPTAVANVPGPISSPGNGVRWFDVDLSDQRMYAYEGDTLMRTFVVSTGTWQTPTLTGRFKVWIKLKSAPMSGPGYYLPNVPHIMYYDGDYGIHGAYWHNNFGVPMSHGCINLNLTDAEWAYNFASVGTVVNIHE